MKTYGNQIRQTVAAIVFAGLFAAGLAAAQDYSWTDSGGGEYTDETNWTGTGIPSTTHVVEFALPGTYTVDGFGATGITNLRAHIGALNTDPGNIDITFDIRDGTEGRTWNLTDTASNPASMNIGSADGDTTVRLTQGTLQTRRLRMTNTSSLYIETDATPSIHILQMLGANEVRVNSATVTVTNQILMSSMFPHHQLLEFNNANVTFTDNFGSLHSSGGAVEAINITNGTTINGLQALRLYRVEREGSRVLIDGGSQVNINGTGVFEGLGAHIGMGGIGKHGVLIVRDSGTRVTAKEILYTFDGDGGAGVMRIQNGAEVDITTGNARIAVGGGNVNGLLEVADSGSLLKGGVLYLGGTAEDTQSGQGRLEVLNQGRVEISGLVQAFANSKIVIDSEGDTGTLIEAGSLDLKADSTLDVTLYASQRSSAGGAPLLLSLGHATITDALFEIEIDDAYLPVVGDMFTLMQVNGDLTGQFFGLANNDTVLTGLGPGVDLDLRINYNLNNDSITLTVIPEPGTLGLLIGAAGLLAWVRRRR